MTIALNKVKIILKNKLNLLIYLVIIFKLERGRLNPLSFYMDKFF